MTNRPKLELFQLHSVFMLREYLHNMFTVILTLFRWVRKNSEKRLLASSSPSVLRSARIGQLGDHWTDFHEI